MAISSLAVWLAGAMVNQIFPVIRDSWGKNMTFFIFAAILVPQFLFVWKIMPETKGRSLEEIERSFHGAEGSRPGVQPIGRKTFADGN